MSVQIKTTILCGHERHKVELLTDGTWRAQCPNAVDDARRLGTLATLGSHIGETRGCAGLIALCSIGLPARVVGSGASNITGLGVWQPTYILYETNAVVRRVLAECAEKRDEHKDALKVARASLMSPACVRGYWRDRDPDDEKPEDLVTFEPDAVPYVGQIVAETPYSDWIVPLQPNWLSSVGSFKPVVDRKFVVGVAEHPGFVLALERDDEHHGAVFVREFAMINGKMGKVKSA